MLSIRRSAALAAGLLFACLVLLTLVPGCTDPVADGYSRHRPWRASLGEQVDQDVQAMLDGMRRAHMGP
jgi:hypothetical protein